MARSFGFRYANNTYTAIIIDTQQELNASCAILSKQDNLMGLDIETYPKIGYEYRAQVKKIRRAGLCPLMSDIRLIQIYDGAKSIFVYDLKKLTDTTALVDILKTKKFVAHNAAFELGHLRNFGIIKMDLDCSMVAAMTVDRAERSPFIPHEDEEDEQLANPYQGYGLEIQVTKHLGFAISKLHQTADWSKETLSAEEYVYSALDSVACKLLMDVLYTHINTFNMGRYYDLLKNMIPVIVEMDRTGVDFDMEKHKVLIARWVEEEQEAKTELDKHFSGVNLNSTQQLNAWLRSKYPNLVSSWPKTNPDVADCQVCSFGKDALLEYEHLEEINILSKYKKHSKMISTYGESLKDHIHPVTKRIHAQFTLGETRTGRLSSRAPNGQNYPSVDEFRELFIAPPGKKMIVLDLSQIEIRVGATLSKDKVMLKAFEDGTDLHSLIVATLSGRPIETVTKEQRKLGKILTFSLQFGTGPTGLMKRAKAQGIELTFDQAQEAYDTYHSLYAGYSAYCTAQRASATKYGYTITPFGKVRRLHTKEVYTKAINTPVQGGAAECIMCALVLVFNRLISLGLLGRVSIAMTVHDEVMLIADDDVATESFNILKEGLLKGCLKVLPSIPIKDLSQGGIGNNWSEAK
jgi:DNA polymerase-1